MAISILWLALSWTSVVAASTAGATVQVQLVAPAAVQEGDLIVARETLETLLDRAGIIAEWRDCSGLSPCDAEQRGVTPFIVRLLPVRRPNHDHVLGDFIQDSSLSSPTVLVYLPAAADKIFAIRSSALGRTHPSVSTIEAGHLIGLTIAHEIGHGLGLRHSARGVMQTDVDVEDMLALRQSRLGFTAKEAAHMRERIDEQRKLSQSPSRNVAGAFVTGDVDTRTLQAALEVLPRRPERIVMVDAKAALPAQEKQTRDLDAFVPVGSRVIYLRRQSATLLAAEYSGGPYVLMLAAVIWHEMAHAEGFDERHAQEREEDLWKQFVQRGIVDSGVGLSYLNELRRRR